MKDSRIIRLVAGLTILGAAGSAALAIRGGLPPRVDPKPHRAVGEVMARQALSLLKAGGEISIIARDTSTFANPAADFQLASFRKTVAAAHARIGACHLLQVDPLRPVEVPPGDFCELIRSSTKGSVVVSFMGPPLLSDAQRKQLGEIKPTIVAFCSGNLPDHVDLRELFGQGLLHAAVVSRRTVDPALRSQDLAGCFDRAFVAVTPDNLAPIASR